MYSIRKKTKIRIPWNKGKLIGQKAPLTPQEIWSIRIRLENEGRRRDLALFNLAIDSKLRASDLLKIRVSDVARDGRALSRAMISQKKTGQPVRFEITARTGKSIEQWIEAAKLVSSDFLFPSRQLASPHLSTRQYARILESWVTGIGLDPAAYGTHSMRRTKATLIYRRTKNLRAVQLLLGHSKLDSTVRYLGIEIDDALEISEQTDV
jgi:integrase